MSKDFNGNMKDKDIIKILQVSKATYYKYKSELQQAANALEIEEQHNPDTAASN